jgi:transcriptional/translational regulatory protein YebC/TACO1
MTLEFLVPPDIALMVDVETDNKTRTLHDIRESAKKSGAVLGSVAFYFAKRGKAVFKQKDGGPSLTELLDEAIEHEGVLDVEELPDGDFLTWTEPTHLTAVTKALADKFALEVLESDLIYAANEDNLVNIDSSQAVEELESLVSGISEFSEVKAIYANIRQGSIDDEQWERIERNIDV